MITSGRLCDKAQQQVFASYVQRMLSRRGAHRQYPVEQTMHWLATLAQQMKRRSQTLFYIERMQPDWLPGGRVQRTYAYLGVRLPGILMGIMLSLFLYLSFFIPYLGPFIVTNVIFFGLLGGLLGSLLSRNQVVQGVTTEMAPSEKGFSCGLLARGAAALGTGIVMGVVIAALDKAPYFSNGATPEQRIAIGGLVGVGSLLLTLLIKPGPPTQSSSAATGTSWPSRGSALLHSQHTRNWGLAGSIMGLSLALSYLTMAPLTRVYPGYSYTIGYTTLISLPVQGLIFGLPFGLASGFLSIVIERSGAIQPIETWSWKSLRRSLARHLKNMLRVGVLVGLITVLGFVFVKLNPSGGWFVSSFFLSLVWCVGLSATVMRWLLVGLVEGVTGEQLNEQRRVVPNRGIYRSARNGLLFGVIGGSSCLFTYSLVLILFLSIPLLMNGSYVSLLAQMGANLLKYVFGFAICGFAACFIIGLRTGWLACIRHYLLRWLLWRHGSIPWNYAGFLDYAAERILLRKAGGGYIFIHRLLLDYFAELETTE